MVQTRSGNAGKMQILKAGRGRFPVLLFRRSSMTQGAWKSLSTDSALARAALGMLLCFGAFMIVALVVAYLRGRL
jgi:hypothetical protein